MSFRGSIEHSVSTTVVGSTLELAEQIPPLLAELFNMSVAVSPTPNGGGAPKSVYVPKPLSKPLTLTINSEPAGAKVYLNGEDIGHHTLFQRQSVSGDLRHCIR